MIRKFIEAISSQIENDKLTKELEKANKLNEQLLQRCETLSIDNRKMYVRVKQYERKIRGMREKNGKRNTRNKTTGISKNA
jgi:predicted  nucleic acid-binding Zn-ribbon protein